MTARVQKEIKRLLKAPPPGICVWPTDENSTAQLQVQMQGPVDTPYEQGLFKLEIRLPNRYPFEPPQVQFKTSVYHCNIDSQGRICLDFLNMPPKGSWGPALDLSKVLLAVRQLLAEPNPRDPLVVEIAEEYISNPERFKAKARQHAAVHARPDAASSQHRPANGQEEGTTAATAEVAAAAAAPPPLAAAGPAPPPVTAAAPLPSPASAATESTATASAAPSAASSAPPLSYSGFH